MTSINRFSTIALVAAFLATAVVAQDKKATKAGEVKYQPKATFSNKNVGKTDMKFFSVTLK
jgi:hypothetical protein